nr:DEAD/DEAH box helicase family protein [Microvirga mediterraneensis]
MTLRPFQADLVQEVRAQLRQHQSVVLQVPTGAGKTVMGASMMINNRAKGKRAWFMTHRDFLIDQTAQTFDRAGLDHAFIASGWPYYPQHPTQIVSIQTVVRRLDLLTPPDLLIWDEGHHIAAGSWAKIFEWAKGAKHIILTATPARLDGRGLNDYAGHMVRGPSVSWLMEQGYLSKYRAFAPSMPDLTGVHTRMGDYVASELDDAYGSVLIGDMVSHYQRLAMGKRAMYFATSIKKSKQIVDTFNAAGIPAAHLDGTTPRNERAMVARAVAKGDVMVISNCSLAGEGYDLSAQAGMDVTLEVVGLARPTQSLSLYLQMVGRALRPKTEPAIILDHAGCLIKHGLPDDEREWKLEGTEKKKQASGGTVRTCEECFGVYPMQKSKCPYCGHVHQVAASAAREVKQVDGTLEEVDPVKLRERRKAEEKEATTVEDLIKLGKMRGYKDPIGWAANMMTVRKKYERGREQMAQRRAEHQAATLRLW